MFRNRELSEFGHGYDIPADYHLGQLNFEVKCLGKMFRGTKKSYHWNFDIRLPASTDEKYNSWKLITIVLTDSCYSKNKSLLVNGKIVIDKEKM
jgi:hypothetical protein